VLVQALGITPSARERERIGRTDTSNPEAFRHLLTLVRRGAHPHIIGDNCYFSFKIDAPRLVTGYDGIHRTNEIIAPPLIHQGIVPEIFGHGGSPGFTD
jgi:hypothetical protein